MESDVTDAFVGCSGLSGDSPAAARAPPSTSTTTSATYATSTSAAAAPRPSGGDDSATHDQMAEDELAEFLQAIPGPQEEADAEGEGGLGGRDTAAAAAAQQAARARGKKRWRCCGVAPARGGGARGECAVGSVETLGARLQGILALVHRFHLRVHRCPRFYLPRGGLSEAGAGGGGAGADLQLYWIRVCTCEHPGTVVVPGDVHTVVVVCERDGCPTFLLMCVRDRIVLEAICLALRCTLVGEDVTLHERLPGDETIVEMLALLIDKLVLPPQPPIELLANPPRFSVTNEMGDQEQINSDTDCNLSFIPSPPLSLPPTPQTPAPRHTIRSTTTPVVTPFSMQTLISSNAPSPMSTSLLTPMLMSPPASAPMSIIAQTPMSHKTSLLCQDTPMHATSTSIISGEIDHPQPAIPPPTPVTTTTTTSTTSQSTAPRAPLRLRLALPPHNTPAPALLLRHTPIFPQASQLRASLSQPQQQQQQPKWLKMLEKFAASTHQSHTNDNNHPTSTTTTSTSTSSEDDPLECISVSVTSELRVEELRVPISVRVSIEAPCVAQALVDCYKSGALPKPHNTLLVACEEQGCGSRLCCRNINGKKLCEPVQSSGAKTSYEVFWETVRASPDKPGFGTRRILQTHSAVIDGKPITKYEVSPFEWMTYKKAGETVTALGSGLIAAGGKQGDIVGFFCDTCMEWTLLLQALYTQGLIAATIYANLGVEGVAHIVAITEMKFLFTSAEFLDIILQVLDICPSNHLQTLIIKGTADQSKVDQLNSRGIRVVVYEELEVLGKSNLLAHNPPNPSDDAMIIFTSGTMSNPKGVILNHSNILAGGIPPEHALELGHDTDDTFLAFLPAAHIFEISVENSMIGHQCKIGYGTRRTLTDEFMSNCIGDFRELAPTIVVGVPLIFEKLRKGILTKIHRSPLPVQIMFRTALGIKLRLIGRLRHTILSRVVCTCLDKILFLKIKEAVVGHRLRACVSGAASLSPETQRFLVACLCCPVVAGYGLTETSAIVSIQHPDDLSFGRCGAPACTTDVKLIDVPELNYTSRSVPYPCGEIASKGHQIARSYYKLPQETAESFLPDGWFLTGDIGRLHPDGTIEVIDRKKNVVKLAHGEYIPLEHIEKSYSRSSFVDNFCLYATSRHEFAVGIAVLSKSRVESLLGQKFLTAEEFSLASKRSEVVRSVTSSLQRAAEEAKIAKNHRARAFCLTTDEWTVESGMLTAAMKLKRPSIASHYATQIKAAYDSISSSL
ncbi:Long-chain-fatty-acid-CoA ligase [Pelomyxa schiedti]|nr:Long-chain-fatty-acid-CoA ligase [Pelomyxa schiedti]